LAWLRDSGLISSSTCDSTGIWSLPFSCVLEGRKSRVVVVVARQGHNWITAIASSLTVIPLSPSHIQTVIKNISVRHGLNLQKQAFLTTQLSECIVWDNSLQAPSFGEKARKAKTDLPMLSTGGLYSHEYYQTTHFVHTFLCKFSFPEFNQFLTPRLFFVFLLHLNYGQFFALFGVFFFKFLVATSPFKSKSVFAF
jgi:hypothetical protein